MSVLSVPVGLTTFSGYLYVLCFWHQETRTVIKTIFPQPRWFLFFVFPRTRTIYYDMVMTSTHPCPQCSNLTTSSHYHYPAIICKYVYMYYVLSWPLDQIPINTQDVYERYAVAGLARRWPNYYQDTWVDLQMCKVSRILQCLPSPRWTNLHCETIRCLRITSLEIHPILIKYTHTKKYIFHVIYIII